MLPRPATAAVPLPRSMSTTVRYPLACPTRAITIASLARVSAQRGHALGTIGTEARSSTEEELATLRELAGAAVARIESRRLAPDGGPGSTGGDG